MPEEQIATFPSPRARVRAMKEYHPPLGCRDSLRLDFNENTVACSMAVRDVLSRIAAGDLTRYPERAPIELSVARHLGLKAEQVALTNGVDEAIHVLFEAFLEVGNELLLPVPTYTMYEVYASATDANVIAIQAADDLQFPFERLVDSITPRTKIIAIANPNSPAGSVASREEIIRIAQLAPHAIVLVDEAYFHFYKQIRNRPRRPSAQSRGCAHLFKSLRLGRTACGRTCWFRGHNALGPSRALSIQREFDCSRMPSGSSRRLCVHRLVRRRST